MDLAARGHVHKHQHTNVILVIFETATTSHRVAVPRRSWKLLSRAPGDIESASSATVRIETQCTEIHRGYIITEAASLIAVLTYFRPLRRAFHALVEAVADLGPIKGIVLPQPMFENKRRLHDMLGRDGPRDRLKHSLIMIGRACVKDDEPRGIAHQILLCLL